MKWKSQSTNEVGEEHDPLVGSRSRHDLPCIRQPVRDIYGQVSGRPKLSNVLVLDGGDHPLALTSGSGHGCLSGKEMRTWALELEIEKAETERERV